MKTSDPITKLSYARLGDQVRVQMGPMGVQEMHSVLMGLWLRLDPDQRMVHVAMLAAYVRDQNTALLTSVTKIVAGLPGQEVRDLQPYIDAEHREDTDG